MINTIFRIFLSDVGISRPVLTSGRIIAVNSSTYVLYNQVLESLPGAILTPTVP